MYDRLQMYPFFFIFPPLQHERELNIATEKNQ